MRSKQAVMEFFADQTGDVFVRLRPNGVATYVSGSIRALGHEPEDVIGTSGLHLVHPDDRAKFLANTEAAIRGERQSPRDRVHRFRTGDGRMVWLEGNPRVIRNARGHVTEVLNVFRDVTDRHIAEAEAAAQAEVFRSAFEHAGVGKALVSLEGRFLRVNPAFCHIVGQPEARMRRLDFQSITHPDDLEADLDLLQRLTQGEIPSYQMDKRYVRPDGAVVWVNLTVSMIRSEAGDPQFYVAQVQDLTQRIEAEAALAESEERFRRLAENSTDLVMECSPDGALRYLSPACLLLTGYAPDEVLGRTALKWLHPDDRAVVTAAFQEQVTTAGGAPPRAIEYRITARDGRVVWMESSPRARVDATTGRVVTITDTGRDVTARKALEGRLAEARDAAEAAAQAKADFLANMSHEIRTPLTAMLGFTSLLSSRADLTGDARYQVERVSGAAKALLAIVNDVLDFSKLEAGQMPIRRRPTAIWEAISDSLALFEPQAAAKGIVLHMEAADDLPTADVDPDRLRQVLLNLIGNAVKFTERGAVNLRAAYDAHSERLRIEIEDSGPGMDQEQQAKLFQRFSQVDASSTRRHGGTGLGLAICRGLVEAMGGEVGVRSAPGRGSTFWFYIVAPQAEPDPAETEESRVVLDGIRLLVADDNPANRELVRALLTPLGVEVSEACDGNDAVRAAGLTPFDAILMDVRMPGCDGPDAVLQIRGRPGPNVAIPILAFTADFDLDRYGEQATRGFDGVVGKPINGPDLIATLAHHTAFDLCTSPQRETGP